MLSALYRKKMYFFTDDDRGLEVQWFWCAPNAKDFPFPMAFVDGVWETSLQLSTQIGERQLEDPTLKVFGTPTSATGQGPPCGTKQQWQNGFPIGTFSGVPYNSQGIPLCCGFSPGPPGPAIFVGSINTAIPGQISIALPAGSPGIVVVTAAGISGAGSLCTVTSAIAGPLTPIQTQPGPAGATFALSTVGLFWFAWNGAADTITLGGIPGGGIALASVVIFPGGAGTLSTSTSGVGAGSPMTIAIGASAPNAALLASQLYDWPGGLQMWSAPFLPANVPGTPDVDANYDAVTYAIDTGYYLTPTGAPITAQDGVASVGAWASVAGAWL